MTRISSPVFVGRRHEIAELRHAWEAVRDGRGQLRLIYGEAGIGKSRLLREFTADLEDGAALRGRCLDIGEGTMPFGPIVECLRDLLAELEREPAATERWVLSLIAPLVPGVEPAPVDPPAETSEAEAALGQTRLFNGIAATIEGAARRRPRCLILEDAHWLDAASRDLVRFLAHRLRDAPVLLVLTVRDDDVGAAGPTSRVLGEMGREPHAGRLDLARFNRAEVAAQLEGILGRPPEPELVAMVHRRSDGNPFFTEEVVALNIVTGSGLPPSLRDLLLSHLTTVGADARRVLDVASVGGRWVLDTMLREIVDLPAASYRAAVHDVIAGHFMEAEARPEGDGLGFRHGLVRDAVYDDLLPSERRDLHERWALGLEAAGPGSPATAEHWDRAGDRERARAAYRLAGERAEAAHAYADAARLYDAAWRLHPPHAPSSIEDGELLERLAYAAEASGQRDRAIDRLRDAVELPAVQAEPLVAGRLLRQLAELASFSGQARLSADAVERAQRVLADNPRDPETARVLATRAMLLLLDGRLAEALAATDVAVATATASGDASAMARVTHTRAVLLMSTDPEAGLAALDRAIATADVAGQLGIRLQAELDRIWALSSLGQPVAALEACEQLRHFAREQGTESWIFGGYAMYALGCLHILGRWSEIDPLVEEIERSERGYLARISAALQRLDAGDTAEATRLASDGLAAIPPDASDVAYRLMRALGLMAIAGAGGDHEAAVLAADRAGDLPGEEDMAADMALRAIQAEIAGTDGPPRDPGGVRLSEPGRRLLARLRAISEQPGHAASLSIRACRLTAEAEVGSEAGSVAAWLAAADAWRAIGARPRLAYCRFREAEARLLAGGERRPAESALHEAHGIATELGARPLVVEIESLARRARVVLVAAATAAVPAPEPATVATPAPADPHGLTEREREVLALLVAGRTNREIGAALFISPKTAGVHVSNILGKLGARGRVEAASIAHRLQLLD